MHLEHQSDWPEWYHIDWGGVLGGGRGRVSRDISISIVGEVARRSV